MKRVLLAMWVMAALAGCARPPTSVEIRGGRVQAIEKPSERIVHSFEAFDTYTDPEGGKHPCMVQSVAVAGGRVFIAQAFASTLLVLNADTFELVGRVQVIHSEGYLVADPNGRRVYFASNHQAAFYAIDAATLKAERFAYPSGARGIGAVAMSKSGLLYLGIQRGAAEAGATPPPAIAGPVNPLLRGGPFLAVYDTRAGRYIALRSIGDTQSRRVDDSSSPSSMRLDESVGRLYIRMFQSSVDQHVYDTHAQQLLQPQLRNGRRPHDANAGQPRVGQINIVCTDLDRSLAFYRDELGFEPVVRDAAGYHLKCGETRFLLLDLAQGNRDESTLHHHPQFNITLASDDLPGLVERLQAKGVRLVHEFTPSATRAFIRDPDGLVLELIQRQHGRGTTSWGLDMNAQRTGNIGYHAGMFRRTLLLSIFLAASVTAEPTPMDAVLKEDGITEITVKYDGTPVKGGKFTFKPPAGEYHYDLYLPPDYNKDLKELFPLLFIQSPGGNSGLGPQKKRMTEGRYVVAMLQEARNGPWEPIIANFCAAHDDVIKRCRIAEGFKYMTGFSGGARSSTFCSELRPGFSGAFMQGAALWPYYADHPHNANIGLFLAMGAGDKNLKELLDTHKLIGPERGFSPMFFDGGHTNATPEIVDQAFDWFEQWSYFGNATQKEAKPMYLQKFAKLQAEAGAAGSDFAKWELLDKAEKLATLRQLNKEKDIAPQLAPLKKSIADLAKTEPVKKEIAARVAFQKVADAEYQARRQAKGDLAVHKRLMADAATAYEGVAKKNAGTVYAEKVTAAAERCKAESQLEGKPPK